MTKFTTFDDHMGPLEAVLAAAKALGATAADAVVADDAALSIGIRLGKIEKCEQAEAASLGLRVFVGQQSAAIATNDLRTLNAKDFAERAVTMAKAAPADPFAGLADPALLAQETYPVDSADPDFSLDAAELQRWCEEAESAAMAVHGVTNSNGADASADRSRFTLMTSTGFAASRITTGYGVSAQVVATGEDGRMVRDYDYSSSVYKSDLKSPIIVGTQAGERTVRQRGSQKIDTMNDIPVIFDARAARSFLGHLLGAISGPTVALGRSFLADKLGQQIFSADITILDEPHLPRGLRSRPFDAEGLQTRPMALVQDGVLNTYLLNQHAARQLQLAPTGHATRGAASQPGVAPSNVTLQPGRLPVADLMRDIKRGLFVTDLIGSGVNGVTGDYSRGASGFLIENGVLTIPVSEITLASTLPHIFSHLVPANDLFRETGVDSPSVRVDGMTLAGR